MFDFKSLIHPEESLVVLGSLNAKKEDRKLQRHEIVPLHIITTEEIKPVTFFNSWGELGLSSMAWHPDKPMIIYMSTGKDLFKIDLHNQTIHILAIEKLHDVHEMTVVDNLLWVANTGCDEAVAIDLNFEKVVSRISLAKIVTNSRTKYLKGDNEELQIVNKFHCNQIVEGFNGELFGLVHHISGKQLIKKIAEKLLKEHGNGGAIDLNSGRTIPLKLKGPHSVCKIGREYWVFDSGNSTINIYTPEWNLKEIVYTKGWGRGAAVSPLLGLFYAGISATRRRYFNLIPGRGLKETPNVIQIFSIKGRNLSGEVLMDSGIEQINNVYTVNREVAFSILEFEKQPKNKCCMKSFKHI